jgi:hypothetical protein
VRASNLSSDQFLYYLTMLYELCRHYVTLSRTGKWWREGDSRCGREWPWPICRYSPRIFLERLGNTMDSCQDILFFN